jgi:hypothetical protein
MLGQYKDPPIIGVTHFFAEAIATEEDENSARTNSSVNSTQLETGLVEPTALVHQKSTWRATPGKHGARHKSIWKKVVRSCKWKGRLSQKSPHYKVRTLPNYGLQSPHNLSRG